VHGIGIGLLETHRLLKPISLFISSTTTTVGHVKDNPIGETLLRVLEMYNCGKLEINLEAN
jgi:hypothetical protein